MASVTFKGNPIKTSGDLPKAGADAPDATCVGQDLSDVKLSSFSGKVVILSSVPSLDTPVCEVETKRFNEEAGKLGDDVVVVTVSRDLPFAQKRWCGANGVSNLVLLSDFRGGEFGQAYGVEIADSALRGLLARSIVVVGKDGNVKYTQLVPEIAEEPDYDAVLAAAKSAQ